MSKAQNDVVDKQVEEILKKFNEDVETTQLYNSASNLAEDDYVTKSLKTLTETIGKLRDISREAEKNLKSEQEKKDMELFGKIINEKLKFFRENPDWGTDFGDSFTAAEALDMLMGVKIPEKDNKTLEDVFNEKDPGLIERMRKNPAFQARAANFMLLLLQAETVIKHNLAKLLDPEESNKYFTKIQETVQSALKNKAEIDKLCGDLDSEIKIRLSSPQTLEDEKNKKLLKECMIQLNEVRQALNVGVIPGIKTLQGAENILKFQKNSVNSWQKDLDDPSKSASLKKQIKEYLTESKNKLLTSKNIYDGWFPELPKRLNEYKKKIEQSLKNIETLQSNFVASKASKNEEDLLKQIEMLKKERDALKAENTQLKAENQAFKNVAPASPTQKAAQPSVVPATAVNAPKAVPIKVTPIIAKPGPVLPSSPKTAGAQSAPPLPPTPKSPIANRASTSPPASPAAAIVNPVKPVPAAPINAAKPPGANTAKPVTPPLSVNNAVDKSVTQAKPATPPLQKTTTAAEKGAAPKTSPPPAALTPAQLLAAQIAKNKADSIAKAMQNAENRPKLPGK